MREPSLVHVTERAANGGGGGCARCFPQIVLLARVWLGGHPQLLPGPVAMVEDCATLTTRSTGQTT